jgi:2-phosphoglycolate phosphatase
MPIRAVLFDFDGTLGDSYRAITASVNHVRSSHGLAPLGVEQVRPNVGRGLPALLKSCVPGTDLERDANLYRSHHPSVLESGTQLLPGALTTLQTLHRRGLKLAICSNKPALFTRKLVDILRIAELIDQILGPEDVANPKPAPDMLVEAIRRLGLPKDDVVYVGDMTVDIQTARGAGVQVWVVPTGSDTRKALEDDKPDRLLNHLSEIADLV